MKKELTIVNYIHIGNEVFNMEELPEERRKEIGRQLNHQALRAIGLKPVEPQ